MKKIMLGLAIAAVGSAFAIESSNVVGYNNAATVYGNQGAGVCFKTIGGGSTMGDLKVTGYGDSYEGQNIQAVKLDIYGRNDGATMFWVDADYGVDGVWYGWYDENWEVSFNGTSLNLGEGIWFTSPSSDIKIQSSGAVSNEAIPVTLVYGNQLCPNPTPVTLKINDAYMAGYGDSYEGQNIQAVKLDIYGRNDGATMFWVDADYGVDGVWYGWYDENWEQELGENIMLTPGEAVWLTCPTAGWTINWPSPLANN